MLAAPGDAIGPGGSPALRYVLYGDFTRKSLSNTRPGFLPSAYVTVGSAIRGIPIFTPCFLPTFATTSARSSLMLITIATVSVAGDAVAVSTDTLFRSNASKIAAFAAARRLPAVGSKEFAEAGGLVGYGGNDDEMYRHAAYYVDRLLKGAKPADLPIEGITKFELVINAKTAKEIGIAFPQSILLRADRVIQ